MQSKSRIKYFFLLSLATIMSLIQFLDLYRIFDEPNDALAHEVMNKENYISDKKVEFLLWRGADPSAPNTALNLKEENPYNFILMAAILNNRENIIPLLHGNYTSEQKEAALEYASQIENNQSKLKYNIESLFN